MGAPEVGKLLPAARDALLNFLEARPNIELPGFLKDLEGTHGFYVGDGQKQRRIPCGFKPAFVVFTCPVYPDGELPKPSGQGGYWRPDLHEQFPSDDKGFTVDERFNKAGDMAVWIAWKQKK
ncbi:MAG TPA: hypothetical protein VFF73_24085 [Planctomycetota bacterium]|nr:hypothetical protein [Planctomycetota bacterium]